jgi:hypothetical protein
MCQKLSIDNSLKFLIFCILFRLKDQIVTSFYPVSDFFVGKILNKCGEKLLRGIPGPNRYRRLLPAFGCHSRKFSFCFKNPTYVKWQRFKGKTPYPLWGQPPCISQFGAARKSPREKHRDGLLVVAVPFTEFGDKVSLFKIRAENNPEGPKNVEKQAIQTYVRGRPDENKHEKVERVPDPEIRAAKDEVWWSELLAA